MADIKQYAPLWGAWEIDEQIGQGTYSKVYRAHKTEGGTTVYAAIKHISLSGDPRDLVGLHSDGSLPTPEEAAAHYERIRQMLLHMIEVNIGEKGHPNIVRYEECCSFPHAGGPGYDVFIRMELLRPLSQIMRERPITEGEVRAMGANICSALGFSTRAMLGDIEPSNIYANEIGTYKLGNFGITYILRTLHYKAAPADATEFAAPEMVRGAKKSPSTDMYALGLVMFRLMNEGRPPFVQLPPVGVSAAEAALANERRLAGEPIPAPAHASRELAAIISRACSPNVRGRFSEPIEMQLALESGVPVQPARQSPPARPVQQQQKGKGGLVAIIAACAVVIVALAALVVYLATRSPDTLQDDEALATEEVVVATEAPTKEHVTEKTVDTATPEPTPEPTPEILLDVNALQSKLDSKSYNSAVYVLDVTRGTEYATGGAYGQKLSSALINIPVVFTVLHDIDNGSLTYDTKVYLTYEGGRGSANLTESGSYTVSTLLEAILNYSDNNATNALMTYLGFDYIERICSSYDFDSVVINAKIAHTTSTTENYVSPADVGGMLALIWDGEFAGGKQFLANCMYITDSTARSGLGKYVGSDYTFMNHNGVRTTLYNECSIVTNGDETYIVVYMASSSSSAQDGMMSLAADVGSMVHTALG